MILKKLLVQHYGPFAFPETIEFDDEVTVLTGANDVGKSSILRLIQRVYRNEKISQEEVNNDRFQEAPDAWTADPEIKCVATFLTTDDVSRYLQGEKLVSGVEVDLDFHLTGNSSSPIVSRMGESNNERLKQVTRIHNFPQVFWASQEKDIRTILDLAELNTSESQLLNLAFGQKAVEKLGSIGGPELMRFIRKGCESLNEKLRPLLPSSINLRFVIERQESAPLKLSIYLKDDHEGETAFNLRGTGAKKMISLLLNLIQADFSSHHTIILYDEPETSLHADAQHKLRELLEELAKLPTLQVVYTTHSPAMINSLRGESVRVLERIKKMAKPQQ